jgi:hypothetical protein
MPCSTRRTTATCTCGRSHWTSRRGTRFDQRAARGGASCLRPAYRVAGGVDLVGRRSAQSEFGAQPIRVHQPGSVLLPREGATTKACSTRWRTCGSVTEVGGFAGGQAAVEPDKGAGAVARGVAMLRRRDGPLVVVWCGHGVSSSVGGLRLLTQESGTNPMAGVPIGEAVGPGAESGASQLLVVLDTCYSGGRGAVSAAADVATAVMALRPPEGRYVWAGCWRHACRGRPPATGSSGAAAGNDRDSSGGGGAAPPLVGTRGSRLTHHPGTGSARPC